MNILTTEIFIKRSNEIHNKEKILYSYEKVIYKDYYTPVEIFCKKCNNYFWQKPANHLRNSGCKECGKLQSIETRKTKFNDFVKKANNIYNFKYIYNRNTFIDMKTPIEIICTICNKKSEIIPYNHINKHLLVECFYCKREKRYDKNKLTKIFIKKAINIHKNKYDYSLVQYKKAKEDVEIICNICNNHFFQTPSNHLHKTRPQGCPYCYGLYKTTENIIKEFQEVHGKDHYDYSLVDYKNSKTKVKIKCNKCKTIFKQTPNVHLQNKGCSVCNESKGEKRIRNWLKENKIIFESQKKFKNCIFKKSGVLKFDFYLPDFNLCIEYDGIQHFKSIKFFKKTDTLKNNKIRDKIKTNYCLQNNIKLLRIPYWEFDNIESILEDILYIKIF